MKLKSIVLTAVAVALAVAAYFTYTRTHPKSGFTLTKAAAYRFEPQPLQLTSGARRPVVGSTVAGGLYLLTVEGSHESSALELRMSHDGGEHWMTPQRLSAEGSTVNASSENAPQLVSRAMYAYALWMDRSALPTGVAVNRMLLARSSGMDAKAPVGISVTDKAPDDTSYSGFPSLGLAPNGDIYAAWLDGRDKGTPGTFNIYLARSTDKGVTFHKNIKVATDSCPCCRPSLAFGPKGKVYVAYRHVYGDNERDIAVATSNDSGEHFGAPVRVHLDRWHLLGCPESGPVMAVQNGRLLIVWYSAGGAHPGLRLAQSTDGGQSFREPFAVDGSLPGANHPYLAATDDGRTVLTFSARTPGSDGSWGGFSSYLVAIAPDGKVTAPQLIPGAANLDRYPTITLDADGSAYVATSSNKDDTSTAWLSRARFNP